MYRLNRQLWLSNNLVIVLFLLSCNSGCMNPYYGSYGGYGSPYSRGYAQPNYAPAPSFNSAPGSLYIPESTNGPYLPSNPGTYEEDPPGDDFNRSPTTPFYGSEADGLDEDRVPNPQPLRNQQRERELGGPSTMNFPQGIDVGAGSGIQQVSGTRQIGEAPGIQQLAFPTDNEYGFDTNDYRSLTGVLRHDSRSGGWAVTYSLKASDRYAGTLALDISAKQLQGLSEGDNVDIFGYVDGSLKDRSGKAVYRVSSISRI